MFIAYLTLQHRMTPKLYLLILLILTGRAMSVFCILLRYFPYDKFIRDTNFAIFSKRYENHPRLKD